MSPEDIDRQLTAATTPGAFKNVIRACASASLSFARLPKADDLNDIVRTRIVLSVWDLLPELRDAPDLIVWAAAAIRSTVVHHGVRAAMITRTCQQNDSFERSVRAAVDIDSARPDGAMDMLFAVFARHLLTGGAAPALRLIEASRGSRLAIRGLFVAAAAANLEHTSEAAMAVLERARDLWPAHTPPSTPFEQPFVWTKIKQRPTDERLMRFVDDIADLVPGSHAHVCAFLAGLTTAEFSRFPPARRTLLRALNPDFLAYKRLASRLFEAVLGALDATTGRRVIDAVLEDPETVARHLQGLVRKRARTHYSHRE